MTGSASLLVLAAFAGTPAHPAPADDFRWHAAIAAGKTLEIIGVNGPIEVSAASGPEAEVTAVKRARRSDPESVTFQVVDHPDGITICAVYPSGRRNEENECRPGGKGRMNTRDNDVNVTFTVRVPQGVRFTGRTVNGGIEARGLTAETELHTVNGSISVETTSWATAATVNGSITARMGRADWRGDAEFETVNGGITLDLPSNASMEVDASTVNGSMSTDFPLTIRGRWGPRRMSGTVGQGGRTLALSTVNGNVELRRAP